MKRLLDLLDALIPPGLFGMFGGLVHVLQKPADQITIYYVLAGIVTSAFVGVLTHYFIADWSVSENIKFALVGAAGYSANDVLAIIRRAALAKLSSGQGGGRPK